MRGSWIFCVLVVGVALGCGGKQSSTKSPEAKPAPETNTNLPEDREASIEERAEPEGEGTRFTLVMPESGAKRTTINQFTMKLDVVVKEKGRTLGKQRVEEQRRSKKETTVLKTQDQAIVAKKIRYIEHLETKNQDGRVTRFAQPADRQDIRSRTQGRGSCGKARAGRSPEPSGAG